MREDVQERVNELWEKVTPENFKDLTDFEGFCSDFLKLGGFAVDGVDYSKSLDLEKYTSLQP